MKNKQEVWFEGGSRAIEATTKQQVSVLLSNLAAGNTQFNLDI